MKRLKYLVVLLFISQLVMYAQIPFSIKTDNCVNNTKKSLKSYQFSFEYKNDSLYINGNYSRNCGQNTIFEVDKAEEAIVISTTDTGMLATCSCAFDFVMRIEADISDTIVVFNGETFNTLTTINELETADCLIELSPNPCGNWVSISKSSNFEVLELSVMDINGKVLLQVNRPVDVIDLTDLKSGIFIFDLLLNNNQRIVKRVLRK